MLVTLIKLKLKTKVNLRKNYTYDEYVNWSHEIERTVSPNRDIPHDEYVDFINKETDALIIPLIDLWKVLDKYKEYGPSVEGSYYIDVIEQFELKDDYLIHALATFHYRDNIIKTITRDIVEQSLLDNFSMDLVLEELDQELLKEINKKIMNNILSRTNDDKK